MVKPDCQTSTRPPEPETVHLTPWDLRRITVDYIQKGVVLPKPPAGAHAVEHLASSFARAAGGGTGSMELEVCLAPDALARLVADQELMDAVVGGSTY
ncbi:hypothetical protein TRIUR3_01669 [Triticum urartu]|uniref:Uncharacterized protein n=1 Tax=Triticum urartu TaxID=4572 RepID=M7ZT63_TRIUA|nr:hypothetical protein TRIUR3_01669 [Triticum urartu]